MNSLADQLPKEQERVRELLEEYKKIPHGAFGALMLEGALQRAEQAAASGDVVRMLASYEELKACE